jgi:hypothetical protein
MIKTKDLLSPINIAKLFFVSISFYILYRTFGGTPFLGDQMDQIQSGTSLFQGRLKSFYGPYLSTTFPIVYTYGPFSLFIYGLLDLILLPIQYHATAFGLFSIVAGLFLGKQIEKIQKGIAVFYYWILPFAEVYVFSLSMLWSNVLIFGVSSFFIGFVLRYLNEKNDKDLIYGISFFLFSLHLHLIGIILFPIVIYLLFDRFSHSRSPKQKEHYALPYIIFTFSFFPYWIAEGIRKFANTKSILFNTSSRSTSDFQIDQTFILLKKFMDPFTDSGELVFPILVILIIGFIAFRYLDNSFLKKQLLSFSILILVTLMFELLFFTILKQQYRSIHYGAYLTSMSILLISSICYIIYVSLLPNRIKKLFGSSVFSLVFTTVIAVFFIVKYQPQYYSSWNYSAIVNGLNQICKKYPEVSTFEVEDFRGPESEFYPVLEFLIKNDHTNCKFLASSPVLLVPDVSQNPLGLLGRYPIDFIWEYQYLEYPGIGVGIRKISR